MTKQTAAKGGKKPINVGMKAKTTVKANPGRIKNRLKRSEMYGKYLMEKKAQKKESRLKRAKEAEQLGEEAHPKPTPRTLDNTQEVEPTMVQPDDQEILQDEAEDEFAAYFADEWRPKIFLTTRPRPSRELFFFIGDLMSMIPQAFY